MGSGEVLLGDPDIPTLGIHEGLGWEVYKWILGDG